MITSTRHRSTVGALLVICSCACIQGTAALTSTLFATTGVTGAVGLRQLVGAVVLVAVTRPRVRGRTRREWLQIVAYGVAMATMNVTFYHAIALIPLGVAATLLFLGPFTVAAVGIRRWWEVLLPLGGLVGVILVARPEGQITWPGVVVGLVSAAALAFYTVLAQRVGRAGAGLDSLALAVVVAAVLLLPFSVPAAPRADAGQWLVIAVSGLVGVALPYSLDFVAIRLATARVVATLFALDPVIGAAIGAAFLGNALPPRAVAGIALIVGTGAAVTWLAQTERATRAAGLRRRPGSRPRAPRGSDRPRSDRNA